MTRTSGGLIAPVIYTCHQSGIISGEQKRADVSWCKIEKMLEFEIFNAVSNYEKSNNPETKNNSPNKSPSISTFGLDVTYS